MNLSAPIHPAVAAGPGPVSPATSRLYALLPCAGSGKRSGASGPKQYQTLAGKPMVLHTLAAFAAVPRIAVTLIVVAAGDTFLRSIRAPDADWRVAQCGGVTRAASVLNGLHDLLEQGATAQDWVLVHDAARCLITPEQINALIDACLPDEVGALLALPLADTLKQAHGGRVVATLSRSDKWLAQTPQMFRIGGLRQALEQAGDAVTDEASAVEALGLSPRLVSGSAQNIKVTYPEDFELADALLRSRMSRMTP